MKVLSYNIREGGDRRLPDIARIIRVQQTHAVALLEANSRVNAEIVADELEMHLAFGEANSDSKYHIAWLSRFPIRRLENHRLPVLTKTLLEIELAWEQQE